MLDKIRKAMLIVMMNRILAVDWPPPPPKEAIFLNLNEVGIMRNN